MAYSGSKAGFVLKQRPKAYRTLSQQQLFREALDFCGIRRGISKYDMMLQMKNCVPEFFRERKK